MNHEKLAINQLCLKMHLMERSTASALAHPNIAFIKYWGDCDSELRLPANGSISMNLGNLFTRVQVSIGEDMTEDHLTINGETVKGLALDRVTAFLDLGRGMAGKKLHANVESSNNFPMGAGIASSAAAFAALSLAASHAFGLELSEKDLSRLARRGSGSACRSIPGGFVEWASGCDDLTSYAAPIAPPEHWQLVDCVAVVESKEKAIGSTQGHRLAASSILQNSRVADAPRRLGLCRKAILERDFDLLAQVIELDSNLMHAVMISSQPALLYWGPTSILIMKEIQDWRREGLAAAYTLDAGPNAHVICPAETADEVQRRLGKIPGVLHVLRCSPGGPARLL